ncbi:SDR family NAD(P)-dependent oxidoreductase [Microbacterium sp. RU33B]|uniref:SDR family NAD(P)-dependent oxidoreductase n=1 Tax=Microbacterium sp. RU33B TaxID=1907390 RepID=UPI0009650514|nr:SDR family oxidoreductase [Microbacterium sp. RU33B]SIT89738.1 NAD(P)-dependent dehydrogenase, short-chain alcohol dehydrogenase family [Microbacterium sp. RU33B]
MSEDPRPVAVVVGAGGQIGEAIANALAGDNRLALIDRDAQRLAEVASTHPGSSAFAIDAASTAEIDRVFGMVAETGRLARLAIAVGTTRGGSLAELSDGDWQETLDSNLHTVFRSLRAGIRSMADRGGAIGIVGSVHAAAPHPGYPAYAAAKAGVAAMARQAAAEYGHRGIRVNLVTPGWTATAHTRSRLDDDDARALDEATPLNGQVGPGDVAGAVAFLLSDSARMITGAEIVVDGGASLLGGAAVLRTGYREALGLRPHLA